MSNTSKGEGKKGSKYWMQLLANLEGGKGLTKEIQKKDSTIGNITWISPLKEYNYEEYKLNNNSPNLSVLGICKKDMDFWPAGQPQWDAIGFVESEPKTIILVEAKAHLDEMNSSCTAKSDESKELIEITLEEIYKNLSHNKDKKFDKYIWMEKHYQLGNRLAFLYKLKEKGYDVKLVLLNIVNDPTWGDKKASEMEWTQHYDDIFTELLGSKELPEDVIVLNLDNINELPLSEF
ncbi:hypothetical protein [Clostridium sp. YIM B02569]|uniref:hypothetical protein n=1 Tax=Clostridium sp. YIM B02569 TaxID=2911967 RepID=UPI001EEB767D|nr:hypothetical protein [Clostridium sp. YIM B02569]